MSDVAGNVRVYIRCRPLLSKEIINQKNQKCVTFDNINHRKVVVGNGKEFTFDHIYNDESRQDDIYIGCVKPLVEGCFLGYNATVLAYGQTGSGKTHTMGSSVELLSTEDEGIIPRTVKHMYAILSKQNEEKVINLRVSFLEIYNEEMRDLLHPDVPSRDISIREDNMGRIFFTGAREEIVTKMEDVFKFLERGAINRTTGGTLMNDASSRSHAIFTIGVEIYECKVMEQGDEDISPASAESKTANKRTEINSYVHSKIHLVDLAGSERAKRTGAVGVRLKESVGINQGLLSLGKVIRALTAHISSAGKSGGSASQHVPYRESKLTRFLQDSLGGNSRTVMIACISPAEGDLHETLTTLQYAMRARAVQNKIKANVTVAQTVVDDGIVDALKQQLTQLQEQLRVRELADLQLAQGGGDGRNIPVIADIISQQKREIILDRLRGVEQALQNAVKFFDSGLDNGWLQMDMSYADAWENTVCNIHNCSSILEDVGALVRESSGRNIETSAEEIEGSTSTAAAAAKKIQALRIELAECREDLKRDEEIFGEKVLELKQTRRTVKKLKEENAALREELKRVVSKVPCEGRSADSTDNKDMDVSMAVVASEPHLSQLMEDLETISKEKDILNAERERAEKKCALATSIADKQKEDFEKSQQKLQKQLKDLEFGIKMKQEVISALTKEQQDTSTKADSYAARIRELEQHTEMLLAKVDSIPRLNDTPEESVLRQQREYEEKIERAQIEIAKMKREWKNEQKTFRDKLDLSMSLRSDPGSPSAETSRDLIDDLQSMEVEHARLQAMLAASESRQREKLENLSKQVETYKKKAQDSQKEIRHLEIRNAELQSGLFQKAGGGVVLPPPIGHTGGGSDKDGYLRRHSAGSTGSKDMTHTRHTKPAERQLPGDVDIYNEAANWIRSHIDRLLFVKAASQESTVLQETSATLHGDKARLEEERDDLQSKQQNGENILRRQCEEVDNRIARIVKEITQKRKEMRKQRDDAHEAKDSATKQSEDSLKREISEAERKLRSYQEHKAELVVRADRGVLSENELMRLQEVKDDLEALDAEIQLNELHMATVSKTTSLVSGKTRDTTEEESTAKLEDYILRELNAKLEEAEDSDSGTTVSSSAKSMLMYLTREIIGEKMKNEKSILETKKAVQQLEDKNAEFEQLALVLHRTRGDLTRKLEKQQKEYDDKISFLIQQLRGAEMKIHESSDLLRKSFEGKDGLETSQHRNAGSQFLRPRTAHTTGNSLSMGKSGGGVCPGEMGSSGDQSGKPAFLVGDVVADALRKFESEKQRRELLERKNSELMRELRIYRDKERKK